MMAPVAVDLHRGIVVMRCWYRTGKRSEPQYCLVAITGVTHHESTAMGMEQQRPGAVFAGGADGRADQQIHRAARGARDPLPSHRERLTGQLLGRGPVDQQRLPIGEDLVGSHPGHQRSHAGSRERGSQLRLEDWSAGRAASVSFRCSMLNTIARDATVRAPDGRGGLPAVRRAVP